MDRLRYMSSTHDEREQHGHGILSFGWQALVLNSLGFASLPFVLDGLLMTLSSMSLLDLMKKVVPNESEQYV